RNARHGQKGFDRVLEPLGVAAAGRVPDAVEDRADNLRLKLKILTVDRVVDDRSPAKDGAARERVDLRVDTARVERFAPAQRRVDGHPLPPLERISELGCKIDTRHTGVDGR